MNVQSPTSPTNPRAGWLAAGGLVAVTALAYANSLAGPFVFDDLPAIVANSSIRDLAKLGAVLAPDLHGGITVAGRPLVNLSLAINHALGGEAVVGYHLFNVCVHVAAGLILFGWVRRTFARPPLADRFGAVALPFSVALAGLWLLHPLQTAAVTYVVQRAEAMAGLCYLLTLYAFVRAADAPRPARWLAASVLACLAGMGCKEVMVTAPVLVLLYDRTFVAGDFRSALARRGGYYLALSGTWLVLAWLVTGTGGRGGSAGFGIETGPWDYLITQCQAIVHYLRLVVWPAPLVFDYGIATVDGLGAVWWQAVLLVALAGVTVVGLIRRPLWGFLGAWFFVTLAPSSSLVPVTTQTMAEHRMYLALAAPVALIVVALHRWLGRVAWAGAGALAIAAAAMTFARNTDYATATGLWADTVAKRPANPRAHHNLGLAELSRGRLAEAERHLRDAIALAPGTSEPLYNLGVVLTRLERRPEAQAAYEEALRVAPDHVGAHNNLANLLADAGRTEEAGQHYAEAVRRQPKFVGARNSYGKWLIDVGRYHDALAELEEGIRLRPDLAELHFNAGNACAALARWPAAADYYRAALKLDQNHAEAHNNLGNVLLELDRLQEAMGQFEDALQIRPDYFEPRRTLALLLLMHLDRPEEARPHLEKLAQARPDDREVAEALAKARSGREAR